MLLPEVSASLSIPLRSRSRKLIQSSPIRVIHGANDGLFDRLCGASVGCVRVTLLDAFNISSGAAAFVNGLPVLSQFRLTTGDVLEFIQAWGQKGADDRPEPGRAELLTVKEAAAELRCSISFVYKLMAARQIAFEQRGRRRLPLANSVAEYRLKNTFPAEAHPSRPAKGSSHRTAYQYQRLFHDRTPKVGD